MAIYNRKSGILREIKIGKLSHKLLSENQEKSDRIQKDIVKGKLKSEKYYINEILYERELERTIEALRKVSLCYQNAWDLYYGYRQYLYNYGYNFDYIQLRKFKQGMLKTLKACVDFEDEKQKILKNDLI